MGEEVLVSEVKTGLRIARVKGVGLDFLISRVGRLDADG